MPNAVTAQQQQQLQQQIHQQQLHQAQQLQMQRAAMVAQGSRTPMENGPGGQRGPPMQGQLPPGYLQAQIMRQRQAAAAWAMRDQPSAGHASGHRLGSGILRLLSYSEQLDSSAATSTLARWKQFVEDFFVDPALVTHTLPNNPSLAYELPTPLIARYFYNLHCEIAKTNLTFHDAREYYVAPASHVVECPKATLCHYFPNATKTEMLGRLRIVFTPGSTPGSVLKIENYEFVGEKWDEWICREPPPPIDKGTTRRRSKNVQEDAPPEDVKMEASSDADDHEDLFGRSPSAPRSSSQPAPDTSDDLNKRQRMVTENGITTQHLRLLEISDVLGQLSPLFGKGNPRQALTSLLQNLPTPDDNAEKEASPKTVTSPKTKTITSAKTLQAEAAQVLQKQAAQTLSQALPPPDLDFNTDSIKSPKSEHSLVFEEDLEIGTEFTAFPLSDHEEDLRGEKRTSEEDLGRGKRSRRSQ